MQNSSNSDSPTIQEFSSNVKKSFTMIPNIAFHSGLRPECMWVWAYFCRCADEAKFKTTQAKTLKILGMKKDRYTSIIKELAEHNLISIDVRPNQQGGSGIQRHQITANDPSLWTGIKWTNKSEATGMKISPDKKTESKDSRRKNRSVIDSTSNPSRRKILPVNQAEKPPGDNKKGKYDYILRPAASRDSLTAVLNDLSNSKFNEVTMGLSSHWLTKKLKQEKNERNEKNEKAKVEVTKLTKEISTVSKPLVADPSKLLKKYMAHFKGGSSYYDYKAMRHFWNKACEDDRLLKFAIEEIEFHHGAGKKEAAVKRDQLRLTDLEYCEMMLKDARSHEINKRPPKPEPEKPKFRVSEEEHQRRLKMLRDLQNDLRSKRR